MHDPITITVEKHPHLIEKRVRFLNSFLLFILQTMLAYNGLYSRVYFESEDTVFK